MRLFIFVCLISPIFAFAQSPFIQYLSGGSPTLHGLRIEAGSSVGVGDIDRDGDMDLVQIGTSSSGLALHSGVQLIPQIGGGFATSLNFNNAAKALPVLKNSAIALADINHDNSVDVAIMGLSTVSPFAPQTTIWLNQNNGQSFTNTNFTLVGLHSGSMAFADMDNDGDSDLAMCGLDASNAYQCLLYRNDRTAMTRVDVALAGIAGSVTWNDWDKDGDFDLAILGADATTPINKLYRNDSKGKFTSLNTTFPPVAVTASAWGDYDNDGDDDLLITGIKPHSELLEGLTYLLQNQGNGQFTQVSHPFANLGLGGAAWGDYDGDGDLDLALMGIETMFRTPLTYIYQNQGNGQFTAIVKSTGFIKGNVFWTDLDGDKDLDMICYGQLGTQGDSHIFRNEGSFKNEAPNMPKDLSAQVQGTTVQLSWESGGDPTTPKQSTSYNLMIGTSIGALNIMSPLGNPAHLIPTQGNVGRNTTWRLEGLANGTYYWQVQAIDASLTASIFSASQKFVVGGNQPPSSFVANETEVPVSTFALHPNFPNPFSQSTTLQYDVPQNSFISVKIYDVTGKEVRVLAKGTATSGQKSLSWDGTDEAHQALPNGVYLCQVRTNTQVATQKMILMR